MQDLGQIVDRLLALPPRDRLAIARRLLESIDNGESKRRDGLSESELEAIRLKVQEIMESATAEDDPFERFIGSLSTDIHDWGERHDELLGETFARDLRTRG